MVAHRIKAMRYAFMEHRPLPKDPRRVAKEPFVNVTYRDGTREVLDVSTYDSLTVHSLWLVQVLAMQAYCTTEVLHTVK